MNNQERNRDALIEHIAEQDRIIRRRNEQIANQAQNAREDQKAIEELDARNNSLAADLAAAVARADKAESRLLTADDITYEMVKRAQREEERQRGDWTAPTAMRHILAAALTEPTRPEGAEEIEAYMRELVTSHPEDHYGELADHLASRGVLPPLTDKTHPEEQP